MEGVSDMHIVQLVVQVLLVAAGSAAMRQKGGEVCEKCCIWSVVIGMSVWEMVVVRFCTRFLAA